MLGSSTEDNWKIDLEKGIKHGLIDRIALGRESPNTQVMCTLHFNRYFLLVMSLESVSLAVTLSSKTASTTQKVYVGLEGLVDKDILVTS